MVVNKLSYHLRTRVGLVGTSCSTHLQSKQSDCGLPFDGVLEISNVVAIAMAMVVNEKASLKARSLDRALDVSAPSPLLPRQGLF
jgi:hypothetical protein